MSLLKKVFSGKSKIKAEFSITVHDVKELPAEKTNNASGGHVYIEWKKGRGDKNRGQTRHHLCNNKDIELNETFAFSTNLLRDPKTDEFEKKPLEIALKYAQTAEHKSKTLGDITLDLAEFCHKPLFNISTEYVLTDKKKTTPITLHLSISSSWTKVDGKRYHNGHEFNSATAEAMAEATEDNTDSEITHMSEHSQPSDDEGEAVDFDEEEKNFGDYNGQSPLPDSGKRKKATTDEKKKWRRSLDTSISSPSKDALAANVGHTGDDHNNKSAEKKKKRLSDKPAGKRSGHQRVRSGDASYLVEQARLADADPISPRSVSERHMEVRSPAKDVQLAIPKLDFGPKSPVKTPVPSATTISNQPLSAAPNVPALSAVSSPAPATTPAPIAGSPAVTMISQEEAKLRAEIELIHTEVKSLRRELAVSRNRVKTLEDEKTRFSLQVQQLQHQGNAVAGSCESSLDSSGEKRELMEKLSKANVQIDKLTKENAILQNQLSSALSASASAPSRGTTTTIRRPTVSKPILTPQEEKTFYMIVLLILMVLALFQQFSSLFWGPSSSVVSDMPADSSAIPAPTN